MGLDVSHDCFSGRYSTFNRWRDAVAAAAGLPANDDDLENALLEVMPDVNDDCVSGYWPVDPPDPIWVIVTHSDCSGEIPVRFCLPLAERLEALAQQSGQSDWFKATTMRFVAGLRKAANAGEDVELS